MSGEDVEQVVLIVKAVLNAYFKEVVEKGVADREKKEQTLNKLFQDQNEALIREMKDVETLQQVLGIIDPAAAVQKESVTHASARNNQQLDFQPHDPDLQPGTRH